MKAHLSQCSKYLKKCEANEITNPFTQHAAAQLKNQTKINVPTITSQKKISLDRKFALACYAEGRPFNIYTQPYMKDALHELNPLYVPPQWKTIGGPLLDSIYAEIKSKVEVLLDSQPFLNIVTDESSNINSARVCNISLHGNFGSVHYTSEDIKDQRMNAQGCGSWIRSHLLVLSKNDLQRINCIATDTCPTMFATWKYLKVN